MNTYGPLLNQPIYSSLPNTPAQRLSTNPPPVLGRKERKPLLHQRIHIQRILFSLFFCTDPRNFIYIQRTQFISNYPGPPRRGPPKLHQLRNKAEDCSCTLIYQPCLDRIEPVSHQGQLDCLQSLLLIKPVLSSGAILCPPAIANSISIALLNYTLPKPKSANTLRHPISKAE